MKTLYILFFIELSTRRVHVAGVTAHPTVRITQQARNLTMALADRDEPVRFLVRDRDAKVLGSFEEVFRAEGIRIIRTPIRAPNANAVAERWVSTVRTECLDWTLVFGRRHLERVLGTYISRYNEHRPHRSLGVVNSRGVFSFTKGKEERRLESEFRAKAATLQAAGFSRAATAVRDVARSYGADAEREEKRDLLDD